MNFETYFSSKIDPKVDFSWEPTSTNFSVRWTGYVKPTFNEKYTFTTESDDGVRLMY